MSKLVEPFHKIPKAFETLPLGPRIVLPFNPFDIHLNILRSMGEIYLAPYEVNDTDYKVSM